MSSDCSVYCHKKSKERTVPEHPPSQVVYSGTWYKTVFIITEYELILNENTDIFG